MNQRTTDVWAAGSRFPTAATSRRYWRINQARRSFHDWLSAVSLGLVLWAFGATSAFGADTLTWNTNQSRVSADIKSAPLLPTLEQIAIRTGWHVFVEPGITHEVSAKFSDTNPGQALRLLLGDVNFALVPETNASPRLYVFRSTRQRATQAVQPAPEPRAAKSRIIPNELVVRLKPGAKIDDIARLLGAKVIGRIDSLNAYRLRFEDQAAADSARTQLASNSDVQSVDNNYSVDRPVTPSPLMGGNLPPPPQLQLRPPPDTGRVIVGLVDTGVQTLGNDLDKFLLKAISLAGDAQLDPNSPSHGTSMAETVLRSLQAITQGSTSVQILPVDVYGASASSSTFEVASGIASAVNGGARIINLSLGSDGDSSILRDIVQQALDKNITIVSAAGNIPDTRNTYPAAYPGVDAVTAIDKGQLAPYANRGSFVSLGAPGTSIIYFNNQPYYVVGTSPASAYVSGLAAGYAERSKANSDQISTWLRSNLGVAIKSGN